MSAVPDLSFRYSNAVDRRIFVDLLSKVARYTPLDTHAYISTSGFSLEDQKLIYRRLGITQLLAFDESHVVVNRQRFNKPIEGCRCRIMTTTEFVEDFAIVMEEEGLDAAIAPIIWLKHLDPAEVGQRVREVQTLLGSLPNHSIVRLTLSSDFNDWAGPQEVEGRRIPVDDRRQVALSALRSQLGDMLDPNLDASGLGQDGLAVALSAAVGVAGGRVIGAATGLVFEPLSIIQFDDGLKRHLSLTAMILRQDERAGLRFKLGAGRWPFVSDTWHAVRTLMLPELTVRERLTLEFLADEGRHVARSRMGFDIEATVEMPGFFDNFASLHRFYPVLLAAEL